MTHRLTTNCAKNYCNRTIIVKDIEENVVTCFFGTLRIRRVSGKDFHQHTSMAHDGLCMLLYLYYRQRVLHWWASPVPWGLADHSG